MFLSVSGDGCIWNGVAGAKQCETCTVAVCIGGDAQTTEVALRMEEALVYVVHLCAA